MKFELHVIVETKVKVIVDAEDHEEASQKAYDHINGLEGRFDVAEKTMEGPQVKRIVYQGTVVEPESDPAQIRLNERGACELCGVSGNIPCRCQ